MLHLSKTNTRTYTGEKREGKTKKKKSQKIIRYIPLRTERAPVVRSRRVIYARFNVFDDLSSRRARVVRRGVCTKCYGSRRKRIITRPRVMILLFCILWLLLLLFFFFAFFLLSSPFSRSLSAQLVGGAKPIFFRNTKIFIEYDRVRTAINCVNGSKIRLFAWTSQSY